METKGTRIAAIFVAMLLMNIFAVVPAMADTDQKVRMSIESSFELEQGLIDALNSNTKGISTEEVIANYVEANKDQISINHLKRKTSVSDNSNFKTYQLEDGSYITFTDEDYFFISGIEKKSNNKALIESATSTKSVSYTPTITGYKTLYSWLGVKVYTIYTKGYFSYDGQTVDAHYIDSWYVRAAGATSFWKVTDWEEGGYEYSSGIRSDIYGRGNFQYGIFVSDYGIVLKEFYDNLYIKCDQTGDYSVIFEETAL